MDLKMFCVLANLLFFPGGSRPQQLFVFADNAENAAKIAKASVKNGKCMMLIDAVKEVHPSYGDVIALKMNWDME